ADFPVERGDPAGVEAAEDGAEGGHQEEGNQLGLAVDPGDGPGQRGGDRGQGEAPDDLDGPGGVEEPRLVPPLAVDDGRADADVRQHLHPEDDDLDHGHQPEDAGEVEDAGQGEVAGEPEDLLDAEPGEGPG